MSVCTKKSNECWKSCEKFEIAQILQTLRYSKKPNVISPTRSVQLAPNQYEKLVSSTRKINAYHFQPFDPNDSTRRAVETLDMTKVNNQQHNVLSTNELKPSAGSPDNNNTFSPMAAPPQIGNFMPIQKNFNLSSTQMPLLSSQYAPNITEIGIPRSKILLPNALDTESNHQADLQSTNTIIPPILLLPSTYGLLTSDNTQIPQSYKNIMEGYSNLDKKLEYLIKAYHNENLMKTQGNVDFSPTQHKRINLDNLREILSQSTTPLFQQANLNTSSHPKGIHKKNPRVKHDNGKKRKICRMDSCESPAARRTPYCEKHSGPRKCEFDDCTKCAQGRTRFCIAHGGGRRCIHPGCSKGARDRRYCASHGGGRRCIVEYCYKLAVGGCNSCTAHGGGKRCKYEECSKSAQSSSSFCVRHGGGRKCSFPRCTKVARGKSRLCMSHSTQLVKATKDQDAKYNILSTTCQFISETTIN